jgi:hypothetical protein
MLLRPPRTAFCLAVLGKAFLVATTLRIEETRELVFGEVLSKPKRYQERKAELFRAGFFSDPVRKGFAAFRRKAERAAVPGSELPCDDELLLLERLELPVRVALGHIPEAPKSA